MCRNHGLCNAGFIVWQGPVVLAAGAGWVVVVFIFSSIPSLTALPSGEMAQLHLLFIKSFWRY